MDQLGEERQPFWGRRHPPNTRAQEYRRRAIFPAVIPANPNIAALTSIIFPEGIPDPSVKSHFLGIQRAIWRDLTLEANYVGTGGSHLIRAENVNRVPGGLLPEGTCLRDNLGRKLCSQRDTGLNQYGQYNNLSGRLNPNFGDLRVWRDIADSHYNSLQAFHQREAGERTATRR